MRREGGWEYRDLDVPLDVVGPVTDNTEEQKRMIAACTAALHEALARERAGGWALDGEIDWAQWGSEGRVTCHTGRSTAGDVWIFDAVRVPLRRWIGAPEPQRRAPWDTSPSAGRPGDAPSTGAAAPATADDRGAIFARRVAAFLIDGPVLWVLQFAVALVLIVLDGRGDRSVAAVESVSSAINWTVAGVYFVVCWVVWQQSLGQRILGLRVVKADGRRLSWGDGIGRFIVFVIGGSILGLGWWWALWDKQGQAWHDKAAGTYVVRESQGRSAPLLQTD